MIFDKSGLSIELQEKQKLKGTYDSPCMSVCNYEGEFLTCGTCGMRKEEKVIWKQGNPLAKELIIKNILDRKSN